VKAEQAVPQVLKQLLDGNSQPDVLEWLASQSVKDPSAVLEQALAAFSAVADQPKSVRLGFCQEACRELMRRMIEVGDLAGALAAVKEYGKLADVYATAKGTKRPAKAEDTGPGRPPDPAAELLELVKGRLA